MPSGADNVLTIHTTDGTERLRIDSSGNVKVGSAATISPDGDLFVTGVCTATTLSGAASGLTGALPAISAANLTNVPAANITGTLPAISAANLTNVPAANITGTLPAISALNLTNVPAANVVGVHTSLNVTGSTIVGGGVTISESGIEASGIGITCANINGTQIGGRRNLVINGAMNIAQRGTSSTTAGYKTVDRIYAGYANTDEAPTFTQADIGTSDAPYLSGFRKSFKIQNGNQTSGAGAADEMFMTYNVEAQDLANSGWDYTSGSSNITLSFWVKSSVAQQFQVNMRLYPASGSQKEFCFEYTPSANTWTKVTKTISGAAGNVLRNTNELGMFIQFPQFYGTNYTANTRAFDTWETKNNAQNYKDYTTTWHTTNDATWEITGLQLEVGSQATPFEHRSLAEELTLCERYCEVILEGEADGAYMVNSVGYHTDQMYAIFRFKVEKRVSPTLEHTTGSNYYVNYTNNSGRYFDSFSGVSWPNKRATGIYNNSTVTAGHAGLIGSSNTNAIVYVTAEL